MGVTSVITPLSIRRGVGGEASFYPHKKKGHPRECPYVIPTGFKPVTS